MRGRKEEVRRGDTFNLSKITEALLRILDYIKDNGEPQKERSLSIKGRK